MRDGGNKPQSYTQKTHTHTHSCCGMSGGMSKKTHKDDKSGLPILFFPANHPRKEKEVKEIKDCDEVRLTVKVRKSLMN